MWLAEAERQSWGKDGGSFTGGPNKGLVHTTETRGWPGYNSGSYAPHITLLPTPMDKKLYGRQHTSLDVAARALRNPAGGVQTNRDSVRQIELIGTCDPSYKRKYPDAFTWYDAPEWALKELAKWIKLISERCNIPLVLTDKPFLSYPSSYGNKNGQRMSLSQWDNFGGWCGHMHAAENTHGDPGSLNMARVLEFAGGVIAPPTKPTKPQTPTANTAPGFPLPRGHVFGPKQGNHLYRSGYYGARDRNGLRTWQARMRFRGWRISVDGLYGNETRGVAVAFQKEKFGHSDGNRNIGGWRAEFGLIGPNTWGAAWTAPIT